MADGKCYMCGIPFTETTTTAYAKRTGRGRCRGCSNKDQTERRKRNPRAYIFLRAKRGAKDRGLSFEITKSELPPIPDFCPVFPWIRLRYRVGEGRHPDSVSLDRIDNSLGYVKGNLRFISDRANILKRDATKQELIALAKDAERV